jgi:hypothetical protein
MTRDPASPEWTQVIIRNPPNHLQEDPDVEEDIVYRTGPASTATQRQWRVCAATFSRYYGVWGPGAQVGMGPWAVPGTSESEVLQIIDANALRREKCPDIDSKAQNVEPTGWYGQYSDNRSDGSGSSGWTLLRQPVDA